MRWLAGLALLSIVGAEARAATWSCAERTEIVTTTLVLVRCTATGTYTTGGDPFSNLNVDLCNSENRIPQAAVSSTAASATTGQGYVVAMDRTTHRLVLLTASPSPGPQNALAEVAGGTAIDGATFMALVNCK